MIPFKTQYDKIVGAYMRNELNPNKGCACFVGNLLNNNADWEYARRYDGLSSDLDFTPYPAIDRMLFFDGVISIDKESEGTYSIEDVCKLEQNFLRIYNKGLNEESLFLAMESTLLMLREIHESKGEVIKPYTFTKRVLI